MGGRAVPSYLHGQYSSCGFSFFFSFFLSWLSLTRHWPLWQVSRHRLFHKVDMKSLGLCRGSSAHPTALGDLTESQSLYLLSIPNTRTTSPIGRLVEYLKSLVSFWPTGILYILEGTSWWKCRRFLGYPSLWLPCCSFPWLGEHRSRSESPSTLEAELQPGKWRPICLPSAPSVSKGKGNFLWNSSVVEVE